MTLLDTFARFNRVYNNSPHLHISSQHVLEKHAADIQEWLDVTQSLQYLSSKERIMAEDLFEAAFTSARSLFLMGDEITAWVGLQHISFASDQTIPGIYAAQSLAMSARFGIYQYLLDEAEESLATMLRHFKETDHPQAAQYWELKGMILSLRKQWKDAIPYFQRAREHIEQSSMTELKRWIKSSRNDLMGHQNLRIVDCLIYYGWSVDGKERSSIIREIHAHLTTAASLLRSPMLLYLKSLNEVELLLLMGNLPMAKKQIDMLLDSHNVESRKTSILHPAAYVMKARVADLEGDQTAMISYLSRALAESTIMFPDVMQELQVVDYAFSLIRDNVMSRTQWQPLLEAMVLMLEAKDWYTGRNHSKSVAQTTEKLWKNWQSNDPDHSVQTDPPMLEDLYWAGYLHDIGKLLLPRSLLNKIAPLGDWEWKIIRRHPVYSHNMLMSLGTERIATWAGEHHQNASGYGYPGTQPASEFGLCIAVADILE
ncbi:HD domain-containing protein, partial [bacterium]|nr:HD domain-containing protein [candidate division CSSED10-310 bacterium]